MPAWFGPSALVAACLATATALVIGPPERDAGSAEARRTALQWTGARLADPPRRDGDVWEVDVWRADGSLVEVTLGSSLELRELDEERGPRGTAAADEVTGLARRRAIEATRRVSGRGPVLGVERESDGTLEVDVQRPDGTVLEVELGRDLSVADTDEEELGDE